MELQKGISKKCEFPEFRLELNSCQWVDSNGATLASYCTELLG
jgi:hypothetical protein